MIRFSFSSFYMSIIFANLMILLLFIIFQNQKLMLKLGLPIIGSVVFVTILRMMLPFEFLFLSHNIYFPKPISKILSDFQHAYFFDGRFSLCTFIGIFWVIGIILFSIRSVKIERSFTKQLENSLHKLPESDLAHQVMKDIQIEFPKSSRIKLRSSSLISSPIIYGLRNPYILLPEDLILNKKQLYYVLRHETGHYLNHDLLLKHAFHVICIIYWWNPLCIYLRSKFDVFLEMRVDNSISTSPKQKVEYLECILFIARHFISPKFPIRLTSSIAFCKNADSDLNHRFRVLMESEHHLLSKTKINLIYTFLITMFIFSFLYIFEASYDGLQNESNITTPDKQNCYFIKLSDEKYKLYLNGKYIAIEKSLEYYPDDIPIYDREEVTEYEED